MFKYKNAHINWIMKKVLGQKKGEINATVSFQNLKLTLTSNEPAACLRELNKIMHTLKAIEFNNEFYDYEEDPLFFKLSYLSEEVKNNQDSMNFIKTVSKIEENLKHKKIAVENTRVLDFTSNQYTSSIDSVKLKNKLSILCSNVEKASYVLIHIIGDSDENEKRSIIDQIKNKIPRAEIKSLFTNKDLLGKTVIEGVFFGPFEEEAFY